MHPALSAVAIVAMIGGAFGAPLLVLWEWIRVRRGTAPMEGRARAARLLITCAVVAENLWWIPWMAYNHTSSGIAMAAWYTAIPLAFIAVVLLFRVKGFVREPAFWACWCTLSTLAFLFSIVGA